MDSITFKMTMDGEAIAFVWSAEANRGMVMSYMHVGQHGEASLSYVDDCRYARGAEEIEKCHDLVQELRSIGYDLNPPV